MARQDTYFSERIIDLFHVFIIFQTLQYTTPIVIASEDHNQAFIQTDKHLTYIVGDNYISSGVPLEIKPGSSFTDLSLEDDNYFSNNIRLDPPMLDFQEQPVGMPRMENVKVQNNDPKNNLHLLSISGSTVHFHCSFFQDKIVPPGGNTSFDVVFLARQVGNVENTLYIHTSKGSIRYQVFGAGSPNPYRLRPYLGARVPINSSFTPLIQMHNPHSTRLQVLEMFASEGDLHLELPSGERDAMKELWEIQPFETKAVMRAHFVGRVENNHTAFIRIRTTKESWNDPPQLLVLPLEVQVSSDPGLYSPVELLDFGILRTLDEPKILRISLINTGPKIIHIVNVTVSPPNDAVNVDFRPFKLRPDSSQPVFVAHISFTANKALLSKQWTGRIVVKTKGNTHNLFVPYQANVLHGSLAYPLNSTHFFSGKELWNVSRPMVFTNTFSFPVVIYNVSLPLDVAATHFSIENFQKPVIVLPQQKMAIFVMKFHPNKTQIHFNTVLTLCTNASSFNIPIIVYNGLMKVIHHRPEKFEGQLDFGTLGIGESTSMIFTIRNDNPVDIVMAHFETNMTWASVEILGMEKGNGTTLTRKHNKSEINLDPLCIKPYHYAVFNVSIIAPQTEGAHAADIWMFTQFQDLFIPIVFRAAEGSLHAIPDKIIFEKVYPGRLPYKVLQIRSTFDDYMEVTSVSFQPADVRFYFVPQNGNTIVLQPHEQNIVGKIYFDTKRLCGDDCYVGIPLLSPAGHQWLLGMTLDKDVADTDQYLYTKLRQKWDKLNQLQQNIANVTIELDTNQVRGFLFSAQAHLQWPSLVRKSKIKYPLTQIGNISVSDFIVENSGNELVLVQILPLSLYPNTHSVIDLVRDRLYHELPDYIDTEDSTSFVLYDLEPLSKTGHNSTSSIYQLRKTVEMTLGVIPHKQSLATLLSPGQKIRVKVGFKPRDQQSRSSLVIVRNNLTIVDAVVVQGEGSYGEMRFSSRKPGSSMPLTFEMTEKHLKNCDTTERKSNRNILPNFTVRRSFTLRNTGDLPFYVHGFSISDWPCEGYGFKVLECSGFEMLPNTSRKVNIAFTPDFTMSQIQRVLTVHTSLGPPAAHANYSLQAMVPYDLLSHCSAALPRPSWEPLLYYFVVCLVGFIVCCIMVLAYFESDRVTADYLRKRLKVASNGTQTYERGKVFDLRSVNGVGNMTHNCSSSSSSAQTGSGGPVCHDVGKIYAGSRLNGMHNNSMFTNGLHDHPKARVTSQNVHHLANENHSTNHNHQNHSNSRVNNGQGKRSTLQSLQHFIKSFFGLKYFKSRPNKKSFQPAQQAQTPLSTRDSSNHVNSANSRTPASEAQQQHKQHLNSDSSSTPPDASSQQESTTSTASSEKSIPNSSAPYRAKKGKINNKTKQVLADHHHHHTDTSPPSETASTSSSTSSTTSSRKNKKDSSPLVSVGGGGSDRKNSMRGVDDSIVPSKSNPTSSSNYNQVDDFDDFDLQTLNSHSSKSAKQRPGKKNKKSKLEASSHAELSLFADEVDEVSSTTTESSGGDMEDKIPDSSDITIITTDISAVTSYGMGSKWKKQGGALIVATQGDEILDDDDDSNFEVSSKSRAHRKIRVDKDTYGGDIMKPDTYELPYALPKEKDKADKTAKKPKKVKKVLKGVASSTTPPTTTSTCTTSKGSSNGVQVLRSSSSIESEDPEERESPPPDWDQPDLALATTGASDLSEYSIPSENFALKHRRLSSPSTNASLLSNTASSINASSGSRNPLTSSNSVPLPGTVSGLLPGGSNGNRNNSTYSSIVSSNNGPPSSTYNTSNSPLAEPQQLATVPSSALLASPPNMTSLQQQQQQQQQALSEVANTCGIPAPTTATGFGGAASVNGYGAFGPFSESSCLPGIVSDMTPGKPSSSSWSTTPTVSSVMPSEPLSPYSVRDAGNSRGFAGVLTPQSLDGSLYTANDQMYGMYGAAGTPNPDTNPSHPQHMTMMQQLQADRRRRLWEHQQKVSKGEDWPGFNAPLVRNDSLWDPDYNPLENTAWSTAADSPGSGNSFWSTLTNSASSGWSSLQSLANIWGTQPNQQSVTSPMGSDNNGHMASSGVGFPAVSAPPSHTIQLSNPPFNPFTSMADIWSPNPTPSPPPPSTPPISTAATATITPNGNNNPPTPVSMAPPVTGTAAAAPGGPVQWLPSGNTPPPSGSSSPGSLDTLKEE